MPGAACLYPRKHEKAYGTQFVPNFYPVTGVALQSLTKYVETNYEINQIKVLMEILIADFVKFSCTIAQLYF